MLVKAAKNRNKAQTATTELAIAIICFGIALFGLIFEFRPFRIGSVIELVMFSTLSLLSLIKYRKIKSEIDKDESNLS